MKRMYIHKDTHYLLRVNSLPTSVYKNIACTILESIEEHLSVELIDAIFNPSFPLSSSYFSTLQALRNVRHDQNQMDFQVDLKILLYLQILGDGGSPSELLHYCSMYMEETGAGEEWESILNHYGYFPFN